MRTFRRSRRLVLARALLATALLLTAFLPARVRADDDPAEPAKPAPGGRSATRSYTRVTDDGDDLSLEIAARELIPPGGGGPHVWLVGAVHVADPSFYEDVQRFLDGLDVVLYESVMPAGAGRLRTENDDVRVEDTRARLRFLGRVTAILEKRGVEVPDSFARLVSAAESIDARLSAFLAGARKDAWGHDLSFVLRARGDGKTGFAFQSLGADGAPGGEGAAADIEVTDQDDLGPLDTAAARSFNLQKELAEALHLVWQGDGIDYARKRFEPDDMALDELQRAIRKRGGNVDFIDQALAGAGWRGLLSRFAIWILKVADKLTGGESAAAMKAMLVTTLSDDQVIKDAAAAGIDAGTMEAILLDRNTVALDGLTRALGRHADAATIGVFYGAAHMSDMEERLEKEGYRRGETLWIPAIHVDISQTGLSRDEFDSMRALVERMLKKKAKDAAKDAAKDKD